LLSHLALTNASPIPVTLAPQCGNPILPTVLQTISESSPSNVFHVSQSPAKTNRIYQLAIFEAIPAGSFCCQLGIQFPAGYLISVIGSNLLLGVKIVFKDSPSQISFPNNWSVFGSVKPEQCMNKVINSEICPVGGGNLAFVFEISDFVTEETSVEFVQDINAGIFMTFNY
ncbi:hypothetical protein BJ878DRAFT_418328, partial [Calycina marina]